MNWRRFLVQPLPPQYCALCAATSAAQLCDACNDALPWLAQESVCPVCACFSPTGQICGRCLKAPPAFYRTLSLLEYRFPVNHLVSRFKYGQQLPLADWFAGQFVQRLALIGTAADIIVPVPLHPNRLKQRGFNQSQLLSGKIARALDTAHLPELVERTLDTSQQAGLSRQERTRNMRHAFACKGNVRGLHLAVVDDVITTGSTVGSLCRTLLDAGAAQVEVWSVARTPDG